MPLCAYSVSASRPAQVQCAGHGRSLALNVRSLQRRVQQPRCGQRGAQPFSALTAQRNCFVGTFSRDLAVQTGLKTKKKSGLLLSPVASFFGVGAPEALVIGVVALIVFGPRGLAEVARNLGQTLRQFQPTLRELQQVSQEFKSTLEQEIGLDELRKPPPYVPPSATPPSATASPLSATRDSTYPPLDSPISTPAVPAAAETPSKAYSAEDYARVTEEQTKALVPEELRKAAELAAWGGVPPVSVSEAATTVQPVEKAKSEVASEPVEKAKTEVASEPQTRNQESK